MRERVPEGLLARFRSGTVIPAVPLALDVTRHLDPVRQRALLRYYIDAGAGGLAVGVHTTQFAIRDPAVGLFEPVLALASAVIDEWCEHRGVQVMKIAGVCGRLDQALREAQVALEAGYHAVLVSLGAYGVAEPLANLVAHCRAVAGVLPVIGFYLQPAVGGRVLPYSFWRSFVEIEGVIGIKIAPFSRYQTLDVIRAVCDAGRGGHLALYTGNDDHIVSDLLTRFVVETVSGPASVHIVGGLLGQWAVWTRAAVALLAEVRGVTANDDSVLSDLLAGGARLTDANGAIFDAAHGFAGCIPGIHEVLRAQGLLQGTWCLDPHETLSPGQTEEIRRVHAAYPELNDDRFVADHLAEWLA